MKFMKKKNLFHAIKISLAAIIAIVLAGMLHLEFSVSAGIVAILSVAYTKKETIRTAKNRFFAFLAALLIAALCFTGIGYGHAAFFVYLLIFIPLCQFMGWGSAMAMDSVLVSHFLTFQKMDPESLQNEVLLFVIGVGVGILANISLRKDEDYMMQMKSKMDGQIRQELHRMAERIMDPELEGFDGSCFDILRKSVKDASDLARRNFMNQFSEDDVEDMEYIHMRKQQIETLFVIYTHLSRIRSVPVTAAILADFFEKVSEQYSMENTVEGLLNDFEQLDAQMREMPLPEDRGEFEDRAGLYAVMRGLEEFLRIKKEYMTAAGAKR